MAKKPPPPMPEPTGTHFRRKNPDQPREKLPVWVENMAMDLAIKGSTIKFLANKYGKAERTISFWKAEPEVKALIQKIKQDMYEKALNRYQGLVGVAVDVLARYLGFDPETEEFGEVALNPEVRQVASDVVKGTGIHKQSSTLEVDAELGLNLTAEEESRVKNELKQFFKTSKRKKKSDSNGD